MHIQITLHLIACVLIILGVAMLLPRVSKSENTGTCCVYSAKLAWLGILVGIVLEIIAIYSLRHISVLHVVAYSIMLASVVLVSPQFFCHQESSCSSPVKFSCPTTAWLATFSALILLIIALYIPTFSAFVLRLVAYPLFMLALVLMMLRFFQKGKLFYVLSWLCLLAGFILQEIAIAR